MASVPSMADAPLHQLGVRWRARRDRRHELLLGLRTVEDWPAAWRDALRATDQPDASGAHSETAVAFTRATGVAQSFWYLREHKAASLAERVLWELHRDLAPENVLLPVEDDVRSGAPLSTWQKVDYIESLCAVRIGDRNRFEAMRAITSRLARLGMLVDAGRDTERARRWPELEAPMPDASVEHSLPRETRAGPHDDDPEGRRR